MFKTIVAVDKNWAIGKNNQLLFNLPSDMKFFKETTKNSIVIVGQKTLESFPGQKPLKNRVNIVITDDENYKKDGTIVVNSIEEAITVANAQSKMLNKDVFVIGGASIYRQMIDYCDTAYVTKVDKSVQNADTFFPNLDFSKEWEMCSCSDTFEENNLKFYFTTYKK